MEKKIQPLVEMKNICKEFPGVKALSEVDLEILPGEVHALVGENGAGKSTIIKILMGVYTKTSGDIYIQGEKVEIKSPLHAQSMGLGAVYQDVNLAQELSVAENFFMGKLLKNRFGIVDHKRMYEETKRILDSIEVHVNPKSIISNLSVAQQEMVAIGKIIHQNAKVVIFDEPTALLTSDETKELFKIIRKLKSEGVGVLYVSHRMEEIFDICDRTTVFKDGSHVATVKTSEINEDELISMMVGRKIEDMYHIEHQNPGEVVLRVENLSNKDTFDNITFEVKKGQIFGMFGLVGSGRTEIARSIFGADQLDSGKIIFNGKEVQFGTPKHGINAGIALLPENRREQGLALGLNLVDNTNVVAIRKVSKFGVIQKKEAVRVAEEFREKLKTKTPSVLQKVKNLSGGNQQKVVISKWLAEGSDLLIFDEPTVGVDVGAKLEIYRLFELLIQQGKTIILISSYLPEVMGLSQEMLVMYEGKQMGILSKEFYQEEKILRLASGLKEKEHSA